MNVSLYGSAKKLWRTFRIVNKTLSTDLYSVPVDSSRIEFKQTNLVLLWKLRGSKRRIQNRNAPGHGANRAFPTGCIALTPYHSHWPIGYYISSKFTISVPDHTGTRQSLWVIYYLSDHEPPIPQSSIIGTPDCLYLISFIVLFLDLCCVDYRIRSTPLCRCALICPIPPRATGSRRCSHPTHHFPPATRLLRGRRWRIFSLFPHKT